jgi:hypothetical protein
MDLDWTMMVVCGNRGVEYHPRRECFAEHSERSANSDDEWTVELPPLDPQDEELIVR